MILICCASELGPPDDLSAIEVILYYYYYYLCQGDVGSGDIVSIGEKGANRIKKSMCRER